MDQFSMLIVSSAASNGQLGAQVPVLLNYKIQGHYSFIYLFLTLTLFKQCIKLNDLMCVFCV